MKKEKSETKIYENQIFQGRLKMLREEKKMSQAELAQYMKVNQTTIAKWEKGVQQPSIEKLSTIAKFFDVTVDYLIGRDFETLKNINFYLDPTKTYDIQWLTNEEIEQITDLKQETAQLEEQYRKHKTNENFYNLLENQADTDKIILHNKKKR